MADLPHHPELTPERSTPAAETPPTRLPQGEVQRPSDIAQRWRTVIQALNHYRGRAYNIAALLRDCKPDNITIDDLALTIRFEHRIHLERFLEELQNPDVHQAVQDALDRAIPGAPPFTVQQDLAAPPPPPPKTVAPPHANNMVKAAMGLGGRIISVDGKHYDGPNTLTDRPDAS